MDFESEKQDESWAKEFHESCRAQSQRSEFFWAAQRARIQSKIKARRRANSVRIALVSAAALLAVASAMLMGGRPTALPPQPRAEVRTISDQQLLADIDQTLADPTPDALAPMELISQDMDKSLQAHINRKQTR